ncbi:MAG: imidazole glycerol phosphate synthase subunit HisH [Planctomycetaceae bacterium]|nr:imidazole glycerol phosphate synthase subunit HisH [Planctomycetaceae bacterium]
MASTIIVDYGMGNLRSVQKAFEKIGEAAEVTSDPSVIGAADRMVLPGVGAFRDAVAALRNHDLVSPIVDHIAADRPFLGICLGMQLLMDVSYEDGEFEGLGIISGAVRRFDLPAEYKIPHMGWNQLVADSAEACCPLLNGLPSEAWFYFVHSYYVDPLDSQWIAARTDYGGSFTSVVSKGRVMATQFHPEKSQGAGLQLLKNFLAVPLHEDALQT